MSFLFRMTLRSIKTTAAVIAVTLLAVSSGLELITTTMTTMTTMTMTTMILTTMMMRMTMAMMTTTKVLDLQHYLRRFLLPTRGPKMRTRRRRRRRRTRTRRRTMKIAMGKTMKVASPKLLR